MEESNQEEARCRLFDGGGDTLLRCHGFLRDMLIALNAGPRTRYRALAITSLEQAMHWLADAHDKE